MKKYRGKISIVTICALLLIALMALTCLQMFENTTAKADVVTKDNILTEAQIAEYTNDDLLNGYAKNGGISKYMDDYYNTDNYSKINDCEMAIFADDPIIGIIPKELFTIEGNKMHIGQEYGFFMYSFKLYNNANIGHIYSIVLVFDIIYFSNKDENINHETSVFGYKIKPLFQREYIYLGAETDVSTQKLKLKNVESEYTHAPLTSKYAYNKEEYTHSCDYTMAENLTNAVVKYLG